MLWRHLCLVRAWSAAGLLSCTLFGATAPAWAEPEEPAPNAETVASQTVSVLDARKAGDLSVEVRGAGQDRVKMTLTNSTSRRLKVVLPAGLVASSAVAQGRGGGGGGFQSMGLGSVSNRAGSFGAFKTAGNAESTGFRSVAVRDEEADQGVAVPAGKSVDLTIVSVCLNFGVRTPNARDAFELVDVDTYTVDPRARKALRSLATYGTSHGVAQATMWRVCNDVPFALMAEQSTKVMNSHEIALAARFVEALDASTATDLVDPAYLTENRLFVRVSAEVSSASSDAERVAREIEGKRILGLPVRVLMEDDTRSVTAPAVVLNVTLSPTPAGETRARVVLTQADGAGQWAPLGKTSFTDGSALSVLDGDGLARALDRAISSAFVTVKMVRKASNLTNVQVTNRLPLTLSNVTLKAGNSAGAPTVSFRGLGIAPARSMVVPIQAPSATVDRVEFNGL